MSSTNGHIAQAAVIPFRPDSKGGLEVLLIRRMGKKKWGIPKGIIEPDQTPIDAAEAEAIEEAGTAGEVSPSPVGSYTYIKHGTQRVVHVFLLRVIQTQDDYPEKDIRVRQWFPLDLAASTVRNPAAAELIRALPGLIRRGPAGQIAYIPQWR